MTKRQVHLNLFIHSRGHHEAAWRHPDASPYLLTDFRYYEDLAKKAHETWIIQELFQLNVFEGLSQEKLTFCSIIRLQANLLENMRGLPIGFGHSLQK